MAHGVIKESEAIQKEIAHLAVALRNEEDLTAIKNLLNQCRSKDIDWRGNTYEKGLGQYLQKVFEYRGLEEFPPRQLDKLTVGGHEIIDWDRIKFKEIILEHLKALSKERWSYGVTEEEIKKIEEIIKREKQYQENQKIGRASSWGVEPDESQAGSFVDASLKLSISQKSSNDIISRVVSTGGESSRAAGSLAACLHDSQTPPSAELPSLGRVGFSAITGSPVVIDKEAEVERSTGVGMKRTRSAFNISEEGDTQKTQPASQAPNREPIGLCVPGISTLFERRAVSGAKIPRLESGCAPTRSPSGSP